MQFQNDGGEVMGEGVFGSGWQGLVVFGIDKEHLVVVGTESDAGFGDVVRDDEVAVFADEFVAGVRFEVLGFCSKAYQCAGEAELAARRP